LQDSHGVISSQPTQNRSSHGAGGHCRALLAAASAWLEDGAASVNFHVLRCHGSGLCHQTISPLVHNRLVCVHGIKRSGKLRKVSNYVGQPTRRAAAGGNIASRCEVPAVPRSRRVRKHKGQGPLAQRAPTPNSAQRVGTQCVGLRLFSTRQRSCRGHLVGATPQTNLQATLAAILQLILFLS
jgi:hypothetical protein